MVVISIGTRGPSVDWRDGGNPVREPPRGLEPIGDTGLYRSPDNLLPGDPLYCEYNSGSPVCGGNPFTNQGLGIDVEVNVDSCGFSARVSGAFAFVKTPETQLTYRKPGECRREYEKPPEAVPPPPLPGDFSKPPDTPIPSGIGADEYVAVAVVVHGYGYERKWVPGVQQYAIFTYDLKWGSGNIQHPSTYLYNGAPYDNFGALQPATSSVEFTYHYTNNPDALYTSAFGIQPGGGAVSAVTYAIDQRQPVLNFYTNEEGIEVRHHYKRAKHNPNSVGAELYEGRFGDIFPAVTLKTGYSVVNFEGTDNFGTRYANQKIDITVRSVAYLVRKQNDGRRNPPPPLLNDRECCMQCCFSSPSSSQNNDDSCCKEVLAIVKRIEKNLGVYPGKVTIFDTNESAKGAQSKVIEFATVSQAFTRTIERIEKISKIIGIDLLPVTVPKTISQPINDNFFKVAWDFITPDATEKIENLFEWHVWNLKQMSVLIGDFQRYVEIEDKTETITKEDGSQETKTTTKKIPLPDIATSLVEVVKNQIVMHRELGLTLDVCMKILVSSCNTKQEVAKVYAELSEIVDWLDYPTKEKSLEVPIQISIPPEGASDADKEDIYKFLQPGKTFIKYNDWDGTNSFKDFMIHLATLMSRNSRA